MSWAYPRKRPCPSLDEYAGLDQDLHPLRGHARHCDDNDDLALVLENVYGRLPRSGHIP